VAGAGADRVGATGADATGSATGETAGVGGLTDVASSDACESSRVSGSCAEALEAALLVLATLSAFGLAEIVIGGTLLKRIAPTALRDAACREGGPSSGRSSAVSRPITKNAANVTSIAITSTPNHGSTRAVALRVRARIARV
jgi:hypothetical protein